MAARLFVTVDPADSTRATLDADASRHLRALRLGAGDTFHAIVGPGCERLAVIERLSASASRCRLGDSLPASHADPSGALILAVGLADLARMDLVVEKATELGATAIAPFRAARSQRGDVPESRLRRWQRIARAACEQCGRTVPPAIEAVATFGELIEVVARAGRAVLFTPERGAGHAGRPNAGGELAGARRDATMLIVGPEGGLTDDEVAELCGRGAIRASLGPRVLRFETAAIAALATFAAWSGAAAAPGFGRPHLE